MQPARYLGRLESTMRPYASPSSFLPSVYPTAPTITWDDSEPEVPVRYELTDKLAKVRADGSSPLPIYTRFRLATFHTNEPFGNGSANLSLQWWAL